MQKTYIYIDDSGDPGFTGAASSNFIIASVIVIGEDNREVLNDAVNLFRKKLGWHQNEELKFHKTQKEIIRQAIDFLSAFDYSAYAIVLDKSKVDRDRLPTSKNESVYMYVIKELLLRLSISDAVIVIDGLYGPKYIKSAKTYLRRQLKQAGITNCEIKFADSKKNALIQLADLVAGAVARSLTDKKDAREFIDAFGKKIIEVFEIQ